MGLVALGDALAGSGAGVGSAVPGVEGEMPELFAAEVGEEDVVVGVNGAGCPPDGILDRCDAVEFLPCGIFWAVRAVFCWRNRSFSVSGSSLYSCHFCMMAARCSGGAFCRLL